MSDKPTIAPISDKHLKKMVYGGETKRGRPPKESSIAESATVELDKEMLGAVSEHEEYVPFEFTDAIDLLFFIDDNFRSGVKKLHSWQEEEIIRLCRTGEYTFKEPLKYLLTAANGSGKDAFVNALVALWLLVSRVRTRTIITSSSYIQLKNQTENYIASYAKRFNAKLAALGVHPKACIIKREHIGCNLTGSEIIMFVTDDPGRAEGYHPFNDYSHNVGLKESYIHDGKRVYPGGDLTIFENEAKTIADPIDEALGRCTYNRLLKVSSPGNTSGHLYRDSRIAVQYPAPYDKTKIYLRRVTSYDCDHISKIRIEQDKTYYGENSAIFRSKHLALFTSVGEQVVILKENLEKCLEFNVDKIDLGLGRRAGVDTAAGGDENVMYVFDENILIGWEAFTIEDTVITAKYLIDMFKKWELKETNVFADDGGVSHGIIDNVWASGWQITRVRNQSPAIIKQHYGNRGAELWFNFARLIQEKFVNLKKAPQKALDQLASRYYKQQEALGKLILESKKEARIGGHGSPDHADAIILAFAGITVDDFRGKHRISNRDNVKDRQHIDPVAAVMAERDAQFKYLREKGSKQQFASSNLQSIMRENYG